jgi:hypothetical protein
MTRPPGHSPEVADVFRAYGAAWRKANACHMSLGQLKVMSTIETCRTAALGGHIERCENCAGEPVDAGRLSNRVADAVEPYFGLTVQPVDFALEPSASSPASIMLIPRPCG